MIICYSGTPGSCKTLEAVARLVQNLHAFDMVQKLYNKDPVSFVARYGEHIERVIYTNISGLDKTHCLEAISGLTGIPLHSYDDKVWGLDRRLVYLDNDRIVRYWEHCSENALIFIDEVHFMINNRDWDTQKNKDFNLAASIHRKSGYDIILVTQDIDKVDKHTRGLIEWTYFYRKNNFFGSLIKTKFFRYTYTSDNHTGKPLASKQLQMDKRLFKCYESYSANAAKEIDFQTHINILKHPIFFAIPVVLGFTIWMFLKSSFAHGKLFPDIKKTVPVAKQSIPVQNRISTANQYNAAQKAIKMPIIPDPLLKNPIMYDNVSTSRGKQSVPSLTMESENTFVVYRLDGWWEDNGRRVLIVNGKIEEIPSKYIRKVNIKGGYCEASLLYFGKPKKSI